MERYPIDRPLMGGGGKLGEFGMRGSAGNSDRCIIRIISFINFTFSLARQTCAASVLRPLGTGGGAAATDVKSRLTFSLARAPLGLEERGRKQVREWDVHSWMQDSGRSPLAKASQRKGDYSCGRWIQDPARWVGSPSTQVEVYPYRRYSTSNSRGGGLASAWLL